MLITIVLFRTGRWKRKLPRDQSDAEESDPEN
jgi:hypothetical protein